MENFNNGYVVICNVGEDCKKLSCSFDESSETFSRELIEMIITKVTGDIKGSVRNLGYLPHPIGFATGFTDYDQFNPKTKFNLSLFGNPLFGNVIFMGIDRESEDGKIILLSEEQADALITFLNNYKHFEKDAGIFDAMQKMDKEEFLKKFIEEQSAEINMPEKTKSEIDKEEKELDEIKKEYEKMKKENPEIIEEAEKELARQDSNTSAFE